MKVLKYILFLMLAVTTAHGQATAHKKVAIATETAFLKCIPDTLHNRVMECFSSVMVNRRAYAIVFTKPVYDSTGARLSEDVQGMEPYTMHIIAQADNKLVWTEHMDFNGPVRLLHMARPEKVLLSATNFNGGPSVGGELYSFEPDSPVKLRYLLVYSELSRFYIEDGYILKLLADWGRDEAHTSPHRLDVYQYIFRPDGSVREVRGKRTRYKYGYDQNWNPLDWLPLVMKREPQVLKGLKLRERAPTGH